MREQITFGELARTYADDMRAILPKVAIIAAGTVAATVGINEAILDDAGKPAPDICDDNSVIVFDNPLETAPSTTTPSAPHVNVGYTPESKTIIVELPETAQNPNALVFEC